MDSVRTPYLLWLGGVFDEGSLLTQPSISPAANRWQAGLIYGLSHHHIRVRSVGHLPEATWPKGRLKISSRTARLASGSEGELIGYPNIPRIRTWFLAERYKRLVDRTIRRLGMPAGLISYNAYAYNVAAARLAQKKYDLPWVCVVADVPESGSELRLHDRALRKADGRVYLSWSRMQNSEMGPNIHLDGTADGIKIDRPKLAESRTRDIHAQSKTILFTGAMNKWAGVDYLVSAFSTLDRTDIRLQLCGPGEPTAETRQTIASDRRIEFLGLVSEARLRELSFAADVFANPRPSHIPGNESNFPSKILEYLTYGKPIISTITPGISPEYQNILIHVTEETDAGLSEAISRAVDLSPEEQEAIYCHSSSLIEGSKTRESQAGRLIEWMKSELGINL
ncbi:MAG: glycosyltransferase family 4 protein [Chloroflexi bacterium]|nr:glycosyltransferase family 4 protein [Chloroflexota bacterium]